MLDLKQIESFYPLQLRPFKRNLLREYLQYKILEVVFSSEFGRHLVFMGGTAMHIVHALPRFSEDLDFDNRGLDKRGFASLSTLIQKKLGLNGYNVEIKTSFRGAYRAYIRVADVLYENKLSPHKEEKILIQLDTEPQNFFYREDKVILNKFDVFTRMDVVPADTLLAQKICAIFTRRRPMGRDFYDVMFLLGKTGPNFGYLKAKLKICDFSSLKRNILKRCRGLDFKLMAKDIEPFLFVPEDARRIESFCEYIEGLRPL